MKKYILFFFLPVLLIGLHACDEGRIYENAVVATGEGRTVKMTGRISGVDKWSGDYSVVVAGFDDESDYAIVSKVVPVLSLSTILIAKSIPASLPVWNIM